jgi:hypothetical protein
MQSPPTSAPATGGRLAGEVLIPVLTALWIGSQLFDAALRQILVTAGLPWLIYARDLALLAGLVILGVENGVSRSLILSVSTLWWAGLVGLAQSRHSTQMLFALKVFLPFLFGIAWCGTIPAKVPGLRARLLLKSAFAVSVGAVILNTWIEWPWEGLTYSLEGQDREIVGARLWTTQGIKRIAGFSRSSYDAAIAVASLAITLVAGRGRLVSKLATLATAIAAVALTTTKGVLLGLGFVVIDVVARSLWPRAGRSIVGPTLAWTLGACVALLPLASWAGAVLMDTSTDLQDLLLSSMNDRLEGCWPSAWSLIVGEGNPWTGRGLGGLGTAQLYYENDLYNPGDNLLIYLVGNFGVLGVVILAGLTAKVAGLARSEEPFDRMLSLAGLLILAYGMTTSVVESPLLGLWLGLIAARPTGRPG